DPPGNLLSDALGDEPGVDLGDFDLFDFEMDLLSDLTLEQLAQAFDVGALLADDDARLGRVQCDVHLVRGPLELDARDPRAGQLLQDQAPNAQILVQLLGIITLRIPLRFPIGNDAKTKADRVHLATHYALRSSAITVMWVFRLIMRPTLPRAFA